MRFFVCLFVLFLTLDCNEFSLLLLDAVTMTCCKVMEEGQGGRVRAGGHFVLILF